MLQLLELPTLAGYTFRHMRGEADLPEMLAVFNAVKRADGVEEHVTLETMTSTYRHLANSDSARDVILAEAGDGLAAYGRTLWLKREEAEGYYYPIVVNVRPEHQRRGLGTALLNWLEDRARQIAAEQGHPRSAPAALQTFVHEREAARMALLERCGYRPVRYSFEMERPNLDDIPAAPLPPGLEVRPVKPEHLRAIWDANVEAFRDHWGATERTQADYERFIQDPVEFQPDVWKVAWDTASNEVAGMVLGFINHAENAALNRKRGWTENICVRRPWRKQGVARALIAENLRELKARGMDHAALGVDTENPTGALRVYESMGFRPVSRQAVYEKPLRGTETKP